MECSIPQPFQTTGAAAEVGTHGNQGAPKSLHHVNFELENDEMHERKKKYLTAKYGQHQMSLIKKRLRVEMWMYDELQKLFLNSEDSGNNEVEIDLDELLDIEAELSRKEWLRKKLVGAKKSGDIERFVTELLARAKTL